MTDYITGGREPSSRAERLPELDPVALRIGGPAEAAELVLLDLLVDLHARGTKLVEHGVEVADREVGHVLLLRGPVVGVRLERRPHGVSALGDDGVPLLVDRDAEMSAVPLAERRRVLRAEEHAADTGDALSHRGPIIAICEKFVLPTP